MSKTIEKKTREVDLDKFIKRTAKDSDVSEIINEPLTITKDGQERLVYRKLDFDIEEYRDALQRIKYPKTTRTNGLTTQSRIFGYSPRNAIRNDFCSSTSLINDHPDEHEKIIEMGKKLAGIYLQNAPTIYGRHKEITKDNVKEEYHIPGTPFTSGIINKNNQLKYHFDTGNFKKVYSCMIAFKSGCKGGHLILPEYDIGLEIADGTVLLFDGQEILHGVTPFELESEDSHRFTVVFYSLERMWDCLTVDEEIARIRNKKTERERKRTEK